MTTAKLKSDLAALRLALTLARRGYGSTSPNPLVGAVLVKRGKIIGRGWHRRAGRPHAEIEALRDAQKRGHSPSGATLYVTLEPCCTHGRTPPCTEAIIAAGIKRVVIGATDPNPQHAGKGFEILQRAGIEVFGMRESSSTVKSGEVSPRPEPAHGGRTAESARSKFGIRADSAVRAPGRLGARAVQKRARTPALQPGSGIQSAKHGATNSHSKLADDCAKLNEAFNHWIVHRTPFVTVKAAMTLDGKIATASGESKWITGPEARAQGMKLRQGSDAILVGINTILADDPSLTVRAGTVPGAPRLRRIILDSLARTPLNAKVVSDECAGLTTVVVSKNAPKKRVAALAKKVKVILVPAANSKLKTENSKLPLPWLLQTLGAENVTSLLVEGGGEVNASFLLGGLAQRVAFFYAPKILGGRDARKGVAGDGAASLAEALQLDEVKWRRLGADLFLTARIQPAT